MKMLVRFVQTKAQQDANISAVVIPIMAMKAVTYRSTNSVNVALLESQGIEMGEEVLIDLTETLATYTRKNGEVVTEWQLSANLVSTNQKVVDKLIDAMECYDTTEIKFATPKPAATSTPPVTGFNNPMVATPAAPATTPVVNAAKTKITQAAYAELIEGKTEEEEAALELLYEIEG